MILRKLPLLKKLFLDLDALEFEKQQLQARCRALESQLVQCDCLPVPPLALRLRVGGWEDTDHFLGVGRKIFWDLKRLLKSANKSLESFQNILDFGCGCGRVLRFVRPEPGQVIHGSDIDSESIAWCQQHLAKVAQFSVNGDLPPLVYPDESFELVYCISVFTHLPEDMQFQWLAELRRLIKPGGILIASIHGEQLLPVVTPEVVALFKQQGFYYLKGEKTAGLPEYYQATFHTHAYVYSQWSRYFKVLNIQTRAINNHQDGVVCMRL